MYNFHNFNYDIIHVLWYILRLKIHFKIES